MPGEVAALPDGGVFIPPLKRMGISAPFYKKTPHLRCGAVMQFKDYW
jgi:hypothetical protein